MAVLDKIAGRQVILRTGVWETGGPVTLDFPDDWDLNVLFPRTPPPLCADEIWNALENPIGQPPIRHQARGCTRPVIVVDDLNRPTPAWRIVPLVLKQFAQAGLEARQVTIIVACGTHGLPPKNLVDRKIGREAALACRVLVHDHARDTVRIGTTSLGTPVLANSDVVKSDFVVGIGGVLPNHTAGFGGGSKLSLGILGTASIRHLHHSHEPSGWGCEHEITFRRDLDEIAKMVGMRTTISAHIDSDCDIVALHCGDPNQYFSHAVDFAKAICAAPPPGDADVVIVNTYPVDLYLTFARMKGFAALTLAKAGASKIAISACAEGLGHHGLFPLQPSRLHRLGEIAAQMRTLKIRDIKRKAARRLAHHHNAPWQIGRQAEKAAEYPVWVYRPGTHRTSLPNECLNMKIRSHWPDLVEAVRHEQRDRRVRAVLYPCSPLQYFPDDRAEHGSPSNNPAFAPPTNPA